MFVSNMMKNIIKAATYAPSSHNTQPWKFRVNENSIKLYADFSRQLKYSDPTGRMLYIALGAALKNIEIGADKYGFRAQIKYSRKLTTELPQLIAEVNLQPTQNRIYEDGLFFAIAQRASNRTEYLNKKMPKNILQKMQDAAQSSEVKAAFIYGTEQKQQIAQTMGRGMKEKMSERSFRWELARWLRTNISRKRDGMPGYTHNMSLIKSFIAPFILRLIDVSSVEKKKAITRVNNFPVLGIIGTADDNAYAWVKTGEALQQALLTAYANDAAASIMAAIVESRMARAELAQILGWENKILPQIFFGFGYAAKQTPHSPRRKLSDLLI